VSVAIRDARDDDETGLIALIGGVFAEYPGVVLDVDREMPQLRSIATTFAQWGGHFWVAERAGALVACGGFAAAGAAGLELKHLYVAHAARRVGLGTRLTGMVEDAALARGKAHVELWTDTRFADAHRLYERLGYVRLQDTRELDDLSSSIEYHYIKHLSTRSVVPGL
jgi:putative acetyltransferase